MYTEAPASDCTCSGVVVVATTEIVGARDAELSRLRAQLEERTAEIEILRRRLRQETDVRTRLTSELTARQAEIDELRVDVQRPSVVGHRRLLRRGRMHQPEPVAVLASVAEGQPESLDEVLNRRL